MLSYFRTLFVVLLFCSLLAACGFGAEPTPTPEPVTLRLVSFDPIALSEKALIAKFQESNASISFDTQQYRLLPEQYLLDTSPPDLMLMLPWNFFRQGIEQGLLTDLSELVQQSGVAQGYPSSLLAISQQGGKQYFLPTGYTWNAIYYNKTVFQQYNLQPPTTWEEFLSLCETLALNGETPLTLSGREPIMATLWLDYLSLRLYGAEFHRQLLRGEAAYDDERTARVFEYWRSLVEQGYFLEDADNQNNMQSILAITRADNGMLGQNKAVMTLTGPVFMGEAPEELRSDLDFFAFPVIDSAMAKAEIVFAPGYVVPANALHRSEALRFLEFLGTDAARAIVQQDVSAANLYVPASAAADDQRLPAAVRQGMNLVGAAEALSLPLAVDSDLRMLEPLARAVGQVLDTSANRTFDLYVLLSELEKARRALQ
jgi:multiple sugar transport system substrate-binding protein